MEAQGGSQEGSGGYSLSKVYVFVWCDERGCHNNEMAEVSQSRPINPYISSSTDFNGVEDMSQGSQGWHYTRFESPGGEVIFQYRWYDSSFILIDAEIR